MTAGVDRAGPGWRPILQGRLVRSTAYLLTAQVGAAFLALGVELVLARTLGPSGRGAYAIAAATLQVGAVIGAFALAYVAVREVRHEKLRRRVATRAVVWGTFVPALASAAIAAVVVSAVYADLFDVWLALLFLAMIPAAAITQNVKLLLVGYDRAPRSAILQVLEKAVLLVALCSALLVGSSDEWQVAVAALAGSAVVVGLLATRLLPSFPADARASLRETASTFGELTRRSVRIVPGNLAQFINYRLDIFLVVAWAGTYEGGLYATAVALSAVLLYVTEAAAQATYPIACDEIGAGHRPRRTLRVSRLVVLATLGLAVLSVPVALVSIPIVFGDAFSSAVEPFCILAAAVVCLSAMRMLSGILMAAKREAAVSGIAALTAVATVVGDIILIPPYGAVGAAVATLIAYALSAALTVVMVGRALSAVGGPRPGTPNAKATP